MSAEMRPFKNSNLFSNHYLEKLLPDSPEWRETGTAEAFLAIKEIYECKAHVLKNYNESQLEENFIRPVRTSLAIIQGKDRCCDALQTIIS